MITQPSNLLKGITVIDINLVYVMFLPGVAGCKHVPTMGELELDDATEDDLAVVADGGFEDVVETQFVAAADCHVVAEGVEGQAVYQLGCA